MTEYIGTGNIVSATFSSKSNPGSTVIQAHREEGEITVVAQNTAAFNAMFYVAVSNCTINVQ